MNFKYKTISKNQTQKRLDNLNNPGKKRNIFSAKEEPQVVRIIPYIHNQNGNPFIEKNFHYGLQGGTIVCPTTYGEPCPVCEFASSLWQKGEKDMAKRFFKSDRIYVPLIERANPDEAKFWGVSRTNYQDILNTIADPDYGDVIHPFDGRDMTITKIPEGQFGKVVIKFKPGTSPIAESEKEIETVLNSCQNFDEVYPQKEYDDLKTILQKTIELEGEATKPAKVDVKSGASNYMNEIDAALNS